MKKEKSFKKKARHASRKLKKSLFGNKKSNNQIMKMIKEFEKEKKKEGISPEAWEELSVKIDKLKEKLEDQKLFSLNDLIRMGLITRKQLEDHLRYVEAKKMVKELFPGMF